MVYSSVLSGQTHEIVYPDGAEQYDNFAGFYIAPGGKGFAIGQCQTFIRTEDDGRSWVNHPKPTETVSSYYAVTCAPGTNCETVYLATNRGVFRSADFGDNWTKVIQGKFPTSFDFSIAGNLFAYTPGRRDLIHSTDNGLTWDQMTVPVNIVEEFFPISATEWVFFGGVSMYRTTDAGANWSVVHEFDKNLTLATRDNEGNYYIELSGNDLYKGSSDGLSWDLKATGAHQYSNHYDLYKDAEDSLHVISFLGIRFSSADDGATFVRTTRPRFNSYNRFTRAEGRLFAAGDGLTMIVAQEDWSNGRALLDEKFPEFISILFTDQPTGYAYEEEEGDLYKTVDGGQNWAVHNNIGQTTGGKFKLVGDNELYAFAGGLDLVRSTDGGNSFSQPAFVNQAGFTGRIIFSPLPGGGLMALSSNKVIRVDIDGNITDEYPTDIDINGGSYDLMMIDDQFGFVTRTPREPLYRTTDGGQSWTEIPPLGTGSLYTYVFFLDANNGYIGGGNRTTYQTTDGGLTWAPSTTAPSGTKMFQIDDILYLAGDRVLWRSRDNGTTWDNIDDAGCSKIKNAVRQPGSDDIFIIYDGAIGRFDVREILSPVYYLGTPETPTKAVPNPASSTFHLELPASGVQYKEASLFDLTGRRVRQLQISPGTPPTFEVGQLPAGVFVVRVTTEDGLVLTTRVVKQ